MAEIYNLRPEVREAVRGLDGDAYLAARSSQEWRLCRAELLRLVDENAQLRDVLADRDTIGQRRARQCEAELAALKARIAKAPICEFRQPHDDEVDDDGYGYYAVPLSVVGKVVRLVEVE